MALTPYQQRLLLVKIEGTEGTDASPTAAADSILTQELSLQVEADTIDRPLDRTTFGGRPASLVRKRGIATGVIELVGASAAGSAAPVGPLLRACGHHQALVALTSATYTPLSSSIPSATVYGYHAGELYKFLGSRGMLSSLAFNVDDYPKANFEIRGSAQAMAEASLPGDSDVSAFQVPPVIVAENAVMTIDGFNVDGKGLEIQPAVAMDIIHHTEGRVARHTDRLTTATLRFFRPAYSDLNIHSIASDETPVAVSFTITTTAGKNIAITLPQVQLLLPRAVEIDGHFGWEVPCRLLPDSGDDEYEIEFT